MKELDLTDIANEEADATLQHEATQRRTLPRGEYLATLTSHGYQEDEETGEKTIRLGVALSTNGTRLGFKFFNVAWTAYRTEKGNLTSQSKNYGQLQKALDLAPNSGPVALVETFKGRPVTVFMRELLLKEDPMGGQTTFIEVSDTPIVRGGEAVSIPRDKLNDYVREGYTAINTIASISKAK